MYFNTFIFVSGEVHFSGGNPTGGIGRGGIRWLAFGEPAMYMVFIFHSQRGTVYRYEVPRATLASIW